MKINNLIQHNLRTDLLYNIHTAKGITNNKHTTCEWKIDSPNETAVSIESPVIILTRTPAPRTVSIDSRTPGRGGSKIPTTPV